MTETLVYYQCDACAISICKLEKPPCDYFFCGCDVERDFNSELEHWNDMWCLYCATDKCCCRTCGVQLVKKQYYPN